MFRCHYSRATDMCDRCTAERCMCYNAHACVRNQGQSSLSMPGTSDGHDQTSSRLGYVSFYLKTVSLMTVVDLAVVLCFWPQISSKRDDHEISWLKTGDRDRF